MTDYSESLRNLRHESATLKNGVRLELAPLTAVGRRSRVVKYDCARVSWLVSPQAQ
jgi:hypothetical protein